MTFPDNSVKEGYFESNIYIGPAPEEKTKKRIKKAMDVIEG
jgi:hypothetical protein